MLETEPLRILVALGVLMVNSHSDIMYRSIRGTDAYYALVGSAGLALLLLGGDVLYDLFYAACSATAMLLLWRLKVMASGDAIVMLVISVMIPSAFGVPLVPVIISLAACIMVAAFMVPYNVALNLLSIRRDVPPFARMDRSRLAKAAAFFLAHRKRGWERHVVSIEHDGGFSLTAGMIGKEYETETGRLVATAVPFVPFLTCALMVVLAVRIIL